MKQEIEIRNELNQIFQTVPQFEFTYNGVEYSAWCDSYEYGIEDIVVVDSKMNNVTFDTIVMDYIEEQLCSIADRIKPTY